MTVPSSAPLWRVVMHSYNELPVDLPVPLDDGKSAHLTGLALPSTALVGSTSAQIGLRLPTFRAEGQRFHSRLTMILQNGIVEHVFYPVFPPDTHAGDIVAWLRDRDS